MKFFSKVASKKDYREYKYNKTYFTPEQQDTISKKFKTYTKKLKTDGVLIGNLNRVLMPKKNITLTELTKGLGFLPTKIAVPESGQTSWTTLRHPYTNYHVHSHKNYWSMHKDKRTSWTGLRWRNQLNENPNLKNFEVDPENKRHKAIKTDNDLVSFVKGMPHNILEGVPGYASYLNNKYLSKDKAGTVVSRVKNELAQREKEKMGITNVTV